MDEHEQYPTLRELADGAENVIEVPAVLVRELSAERDALAAERDHERGLRQGLDRLANTLFEERDEARGERDRLRAVVDVVRRYVPLIEAPDATVDQQERLAVHLELLRRLRELDGSADMGGEVDGLPRKDEFIYGWGVWHSEDEEWIGFAATNGLAAELIPQGPDYEHLSLRPAVARINEMASGSNDD